jgi:hypothetical protein
LTGPTNRTIDTVFNQYFDGFNVTTVKQGVRKKLFFQLVGSSQNSSTLLQAHTFYTQMISDSKHRHDFGSSAGKMHSFVKNDYAQVEEGKIVST